MMEVKIRKPAVAGSFYADDAKELRQNVRDCFSQCKNPNQSSAWYLHHRLCREDRFWKQEIQLDDD